MMRYTFKQSVAEVLFKIDFKKKRKVFQRNGNVVTILIGFSRGIENNWFIDIGFWLEFIGKRVEPIKVQDCHIYMRLERFIPEFRSEIILSGDELCPNQDKYIRILCDVISDNLKNKISKMSTEEGVRVALQSGELDHAIVTRVARDYLS